MIEYADMNRTAASKSYIIAMRERLRELKKRQIRGLINDQATPITDREIKNLEMRLGIALGAFKNMLGYNRRSDVLSYEERRY